jgi:hypothetical protein
VVDQTRQAFQQIGAAVTDMAERIDHIATASSEVATVAEQSSASTQQVSASTEETSASAGGDHRLGPGAGRDGPEPRAPRLALPALGARGGGAASPLPPSRPRNVVCHKRPDLGRQRTPIRPWPRRPRSSTIRACTDCPS